jgi:ABC-type maltose transport system permease subunit
MEPVVKEYLLRIVNTISIAALCLILNIIAGIKYELAFVEEKIQWKNVGFYVFLLISLTAMVIYLIKIWRKPLDFEQ